MRSNNLTGTHLYTWVDRGTVRVGFHSQEHNTMSLTRARTRTAQTETSAITYETTFSQRGDIGKLIDVRLWKADTLSTVRAKGRIMDHKPAICKKKGHSQKRSKTKISPLNFFFECVLTRSTTSKIIINRITRTAP